MALSFTTTATGASPDYLKYIFERPVKSDRVNEPDLFDFALVNWDGNMVQLHRGNYITFNTTTYPNWFTGYITNEAELQYLGTTKRAGSIIPLWGYKLQASSDDYLLNLQPLGIMPPFINTTQGAILTALASRLAPGKFDTSNINAGMTIARYVVSPDKTFSDAVKEFGDSANYRFWAKAGKLYYQKFDTTPAALTIDGNDKHFTPSNLNIKGIEEKLINDVIILGDIEPQGYMNEYWVGDGFTAQFPLLSSAFGVDSTILLDDDFAASNIDTNKWAVFDTVNNWIQVSNGYVNALGGPNDNSYAVYMQSANLLPMEGNLRFTHGEYDFVSASSGVICGLWTGTPNSSYTGCLYAIECSKASTNTVLKPIVAGVVDGTQTFTVDYTKHYVIRTLVSFSKILRMANQYSYIDSSGVVRYAGGGAGSDVVNYNTIIVEVDPSTGNVTNTINWTNTGVASTTGQYFANYIPLALNDLHCTFTGVTISTPMQVKLEIEPKGGSSYVQKIVGPNEIDSFDGLTPFATIVDANSGSSTRSSQLGTAQYNPGQATLQFFKDTANLTTTVPQIGDLIHVSYRRAGAAIARVSNLTNVYSEASLWGDTGYRSVTYKDLKPLPRSAADAEWLAQALVNEGSYQHYEGSYQLENHYSFTGEPVSGTILKFQNMPTGFPSVGNEVISEVKTEMVAIRPVERFIHTLTFGKMDRIRQLLSNFQKVSNVFQPQDTAEIPDVIDVQAVGNTFSPDVVAPTLTSWTSTQLNFNTNQAAPTNGGFEIRYTDDEWGSDAGKNLVTRTSTQTFSVPRNLRGKICFVKAYDARNKLLYSEDFSNAAWVKDAGVTVANATKTNPYNDLSQISTITFTGIGQKVTQTTSTSGVNVAAVFGVWVKGMAGNGITINLLSGASLLQGHNYTLNGSWQYLSATTPPNNSVSGNIVAQIVCNTTGGCSVQATYAQAEVGTQYLTTYAKTTSTVFGAYSRYAAGLRVGFPLLPQPITAATITYADKLHPVLTVTIPTVATDVWGIEIRASDNTTVLLKQDLVNASFSPTYTYDNSSIKARSLSFYIYTYNLLGEYSTTAYNATVTIPTPSVSGLTVDEPTKMLKWTPANAPDAFTVEIDKVSLSFASESVNTNTKDPFFQLSDIDFFSQRYFRITPYDVLGNGTAVTSSHVFSPSAVAAFGSSQAQSVAPPAGSTTDPTVPGAYSTYAPDYIGLSWENYSDNYGRN